MLHPRMLWCCVGILMLAGLPVQAAKPQEKAPLPEENSRAAELVKIGLEAELAGNSESRNLHLQAALDIEPEYPAANWQLGKVRVGQKWLPVAKAAAEISKTPAYSWYRSKRMELDGSAKMELALARWCEQEGMHDRSQFHYAQLMKNVGVDEKTVKEAVKNLDLVVYAGQLRPREEVLELAHEEALDVAARGKWGKKFTEWQKAFEGGREAKLKHAHEQLMAVDDFHVVPLIDSYLPTADQLWSQELLSLLVTFPQPSATAALTRFAVLSPHETTRAQAIAELKNRKLHDFVPMLMVGLRPTTRSQFLVTVDRNANVNYQHFIAQESLAERKVIGKETQTSAIPVAITRYLNNDRPGRQEFLETKGVRADVSAVAQQEAQKSLAQAQQVEMQVALQNRLATVQNERFFVALEKTTGQVIAREPSKWWQWWKDYNEAQYNTPVSVQVFRNYQTALIPVSYIERAQHSCFIAGTKVRTEAGFQPIEQVVPGDRVLSQDPTSGELTYKVVLYASRTPISKLRRLTLGNEDITTTPGHPFWVNGSGWKMSKELQVGDRIHTLEGFAEVKSNSEPARQDTVYNLVVADFSTYFVGNVGALVHDIPYRQPTLAKVPGLVEAGK